MGLKKKMGGAPSCAETKSFFNSGDEDPPRCHPTGLKESVLLMVQTLQHDRVFLYRSFYIFFCRFFFSEHLSGGRSR
ncbi:unnamed protein product [Pleuronectes platessa]|uniref:Uncharacterized protein n=1 Tax=Pleuronectes platessa TaxID=8262 RepID=A0A9N7U2D4_PLEPL|nr:unnamed protein product [Pleuronectes platessa]